MKWGVLAACSWEAAAIATGRVPTFTELSRRYPLLAPAILLTLAVHLYRQPRERRLADCLLCPDPMGDEW